MDFLRGLLPTGIEWPQFLAPHPPANGSDPDAGEAGKAEGAAVLESPELSGDTGESRKEVIQTMFPPGGGEGAPRDLDGDGQVDIGYGRQGKISKAEFVEYQEALEAIERQKEQLRVAEAELVAQEAAIRREMNMRGLE